jgi:hypothetical protein
VLLSSALKRSFPSLEALLLHNTLRNSQILVTLQRSGYLDQLWERLATECGRLDGYLGLATEVLLARDDPALEEPFNLQRVDILKYRDADMRLFDLVEVEDRLCFDFQETDLQLARGGTVRLAPLLWHSVEVSFASRADPSDEIATWARRWLDAEGERTEHLLPGAPHDVVHWVAPPELQKDGRWLVSVDLGTARIKALWELLETVSSSGGDSLDVRTRGVVSPEAPGGEQDPLPPR